MIELAMKLKKYLIGQPSIVIKEDELMEDIIEIVDAHNDVNYGYIEVSEDKELTTVNIDFDELMENSDIEQEELKELEIDEILHITDSFVKDFGREVVQLSKLIEIGEGEYLVIYEVMDKKLKLPLPNSGAVIEINQYGTVTSATLFQEYYQLTYPKVEVTEDEARGVLCKETLVALGIEENDEQGEFELVYQPIRDYMGVTVDGKVQRASVLFKDTELEQFTVPPVEVTTTLPKLLGATDQYVLREEDGNLFWYVAEDLDDEGDDAKAVIEVLHFDDEGASYESNVGWDTESKEELAFAKLKENALQFLEIIAGDIHDKYKLEDQVVFSEDMEEFEADEDDFFDEDEYDDEGEHEEEYEEEPTTMFTFIPYFKEYKLEAYTILIEVGVHTGIIRSCLYSILDIDSIREINTTPTITLAEADAIYKKDLQMKLARFEKTDEDDDEVTIYSLNYFIDFSGESGAIEKINATTGEITYIQSDIIRG
ncbi:hypothetical protein JFL43_17770 [Viridibacillus sp. YIM B01967]|uniref:PepSY domain-containing protein n=1 Tax=Viridibacillus soli TaxID=2798301 RepID=A0ABS1HB86_9BACL|nr:hypothetical protein [Viridibacillus soli]MBK3496675.1 hypothetical protein [Viridibacillus soli]